MRSGSLMIECLSTFTQEVYLYGKHLDAYVPVNLQKHWWLFFFHIFFAHDIVCVWTNGETFSPCIHQHKCLI